MSIWSFFWIFGDGGGFGKKIFWPTLILDKYLKLCFPKVFFQFKTPRSLVLAPNRLPRFPQKFNSINASYQI